MNPTLLLVFISAALTVYTLFRIVSPFLGSESEQIRDELLNDEIQEIERLVARKSILLQSLKDIEYDRDTGKLAEEDYERLRNRYEREAIQVMRELDDLRGGADLDDEIDAALEKRLDRQLHEEESSESRSDRSADDHAAECPKCDKRLEPEARFCSRCGTPLGETVESDPPATDDVDDRAPTSGDEDVAVELRSEATG